MKQHATPCETCPFRRTVEPGALGGSPVQTYVGQTEAGFAIPCHSFIDFDDPAWKAKASAPGSVNQCAGAAIYRSNIGRPNPVILTLPQDTETVFASHEQFIAHHEQVELPEGWFTQWHADLCVSFVMQQPGVTITLKERT